MLEIEARGKHGAFRGVKATGPSLETLPLIPTDHPSSGLGAPGYPSRTIFPPHKLSGQVTRLRSLSTSSPEEKNGARKGPNNRGTTHKSQRDPDGQPQTQTTLFLSQSEVTWSALPQSFARRSAVTARELGQTTSTFLLGTILYQCGCRRHVGACA